MTDYKYVSWLEALQPYVGHPKRWPPIKRFNMKADWVAPTRCCLCGTINYGNSWCNACGGTGLVLL